MNYDDDTINSLDIIERIAELEDEQNDLILAVEQAEGPDAINLAKSDLCMWNTEFEDELIMLKEFAEEAEQYSEDWSHGVTLIKDSYFERYAEELADDIGAIDRRANWPLNCIDWKKASEELQYDYTCVTLDGNDYWVR